MIDMMGTPRSIRDFEDALQAVETMMRDPLSAPPNLIVVLPIIREGLQVLIAVLKQA